MSKFESSRGFALQVAGALGLDTERLLNFTIEVGSEPFVKVRAEYAAPFGAGAAVAALVSEFEVVPKSLMAGGQAIPVSPRPA